MIYLLDTQIVVWSMFDTKRLSARVKDILEEPSNTLWVSHVSLFEVVIKQKIGKLPEVGFGLNQFVARLLAEDFTMLATTETHLAAYEQTPLLNDHRDPFDRLLIATAHVEAVPLISADEKFKGYPMGLFTLIENS